MWVNTKIFNSWTRDSEIKLKISWKPTFKLAFKYHDS